MTQFQKVFFLFAFIISTSHCFSQEVAIYDRYYLNPFLVNAAATGMDYYPKASMSYRKQWLGIDYSPKTLLLTGNMRVGTHDFYNPKKFINKGPLYIKDRLGLGAALFNDVSGPASYNGGILSGACHIPVTYKSRLSLGIAGIFGGHSLNHNMLKPRDEDDAYLMEGNETTYRANINAGLLLHNSTYFIGLSANEILTPAQSHIELVHYRSFYLMGGYKFMEESTALNVEPSVTIKKIAEDDPVVDLHSKFYIQRYNWVSLFINTQKRLGVHACLRIYKMLYMAYNFESSFSEVGVYNYGSHEVSLGINLGLRGMKAIKESNQ